MLKIEGILYQCPDLKGLGHGLAQGDWVRTRLKKSWKSFFKISAIGVELKAICSILSNRGVELLQSFSSFKGIYQTLFWRSYFYLSLDFSVIIPMSSSSGGGRGGRRANSGRQILTPDKLFLRKKMRESKFTRIRVSKDIHSTWNTLKSSSTFKTDSTFAAHLLSLELRRRERWVRLRFIDCVANEKRVYKTRQF